MPLARYLPLVVLAAVWLSACQADAPRDVDTQALYDVYGAADTTPEGALPVEAVLAEPDVYLDQRVKLEGMSTAVCQRMGCWLLLDAGDGRQVRVHVDRDDEGDYRFTLPETLVGQRVIVQGTLFEHALSAEEQAHYAEDAGDDADAEASPRPELRVTATAVLVEKATT